MHRRLHRDPTANPSEVVPGSTDDRELGLHFDAFLWSRVDEIVVDVPPLYPRTGIGNYIRGSLAGMAEAAAGRHELVAFGPTSLKGPDAIRARDRRDPGHRQA